MARNNIIMSNQTRGARVVKTFNITQDNQQENVDLPRGPHLELCLVRVAGTINNTVAWAGGVRSIAPFRFLRRANWMLNSNVTLDSVSGTQLAQLQTVTRRASPTLTLPAAALGATSFDVTFLFDRTLMDMMRPKDSALKTDVGISNNQLQLQFGALADMFGAGAGSATYTAVTCTVAVIDYQEARDKDGNTPSPLYYVKRNGLEIPIAAAGNGIQVKLNTGNRLRMASMRVLNATTNEPDISLLSRIQIQRAGDTRVNMLATELRRLNEATYGNSLLTGQVLWDFADVGSLGMRYSEFWPIPSSADTFLLVDTTAAVKLDMVTLEGVDLVAG